MVVDGAGTVTLTTRVPTITEGSGIYTLGSDPDQNFSGDFFHLAADVY